MLRRGPFSCFIDVQQLLHTDADDKTTAGRQEKSTRTAISKQMLPWAFFENNGAADTPAATTPTAVNVMDFHDRSVLVKAEHDAMQVRP